VAWAAILALGGGLIAIGTAAIVLHVFSEVAMYFVAGRLLAGRAIERRNFDRTLVRPLLSLSGWLAVAQFGGVLIARLDTAIVGVVAGVPQAGIYAVGAKLASLSGRFTFPAVSVFFPYAADLAASGDENAIREAVYTGTRIALGIATPLTIAAALLAKPALRVWVGPGFDDAALVVVYLSAALLLGTLSGTGISILRGMGDAKIPALIVLLEGAVNLGLSVGLGLSMGMVGVALATLIASGLSQAVRLPYVCRRTGVSLVSLLHAVGRTNLVPGAVALSLGLVLRGLRLSGIVEVFAAGCAIVATYTLVMLVTGLSPEERRGLFAFVARRVDVNPPAG
jgi:O-antigen/teichoic acid export membrane protein